MSDNFDWQTEDDSSWELNEQPAQETAVSPSRSWRTLTLILLLGIVAATVIYGQFNRRIAAQTAVIEADILSTHNLINRAIAKNDREILSPLLSGRDLAWTHTQEQLFQQHLFYDRPPFGLHLAEEFSSGGNLTMDDPHFGGIIVASDLNAAELQVWQPYQTDEGQPIMLAHTAVYRRGRSRWLLSPPEDAFWGDWQTLERPSLSIVYPARDAEIVERLADDLSDFIAQNCESIEGLTCDDDLKIQLRFDTDPQSLAAITDPAALYSANLRLNLPTPTLVGLPADDVGYEALQHGYAAPLLASLITADVGWHCCVHASLYQAIMEYELSRQGLRPWPVTAVTQAQVINNGVAPEMIFPYYLDKTFDNLADEDSWQLYAFVDFLMQGHPHLESVALLEQLTTSLSFNRWLTDLFDMDRGQSSVLQESLSRDWWLFAHAQMLASQGTRPISYPEQDIQLSCVNQISDMPQATLNRYLLDGEEWQVEHSMEGYIFINPLPQDDALVVQLIEFNEERWRTQLWQDGHSRDVLPAADDTFDMVLSLGQTDPDGKNLVVYTNADQTGNDFDGLLVDLEKCRSDVCLMAAPLTANPIWSPDGSMTLLAGESLLDNPLFALPDGRISTFNPEMQPNIDIFLGDVSSPPTEWTLVGAGSLPFWVDDHTYGYVHSDFNSTVATFQELVITTAAENDPQPLVTTADLLTTIPEEERPFRLLMRYAIVHPAQPDLLILVASARSGAYLFLVDLQTNTIEYRLQPGFETTHFFGFSPDGRYFIISGQRENNFPGPGDVHIFYLHDIEKNETQTFMAGDTTFFPAYPFDWSADGKWLALILNNGTINLIAPAYDYQELVLHEMGQCSSIAWVNSTE
ncbi:MAG: hypothetical protein GY796_28675 [Chloroflexi bacterium]|nr:hypothetical protein [Chloroflexota bacterium]